ncbi:hypothetical protein HK100_011387 [Physocladia obscura]|uniref:Uncharacterized protein n=1 Tax=Physocladia obscura TaxID=109957 RepID=A0AAD5TCN5_9FUNG|nr:hypothetical protein HK100_011387 [Physocladia obscura]
MSLEEKYQRSLEERIRITQELRHQEAKTFALTHDVERLKHELRVLKDICGMFGIPQPILVKAASAAAAGDDDVIKETIAALALTGVGVVNNGGRNSVSFSENLVYRRRSETGFETPANLVDEEETTIAVQNFISGNEDEDDGSNSMVDDDAADEDFRLPTKSHSSNLNNSRKHQSLPLQVKQLKSVNNDRISNIPFPNQFSATISKPKQQSIPTSTPTVATTKLSTSTGGTTPELTPWTWFIRQQYPGRITQLRSNHRHQVDERTRQFLQDRLGAHAAESCRVALAKGGNIASSPSIASKKYYAIPRTLVPEFKEFVVRVIDELEMPYSSNPVNGGSKGSNYIGGDGGGGSWSNDDNADNSFFVFAGPSFDNTQEQKLVQEQEFQSLYQRQKITQQQLQHQYQQKSQQQQEILLQKCQSMKLHFPTPPVPTLADGRANSEEYRAWTDIIRCRHQTFQRASPPMSKHARMFLQTRQLPLICVVPATSLRIGKATFAIPARLHNEFMVYMEDAFLKVETRDVGAGGCESWIFGERNLHSDRPRKIIGGGDGWEDGIEVDGPPYGARGSSVGAILGVESRITAVRAEEDVANSGGEVIDVGAVLEVLEANIAVTVAVGAARDNIINEKDYGGAIIAGAVDEQEEVIDDGLTLEILEKKCVEAMVRKRGGFGEMEGSIKRPRVTTTAAGDGESEKLETLEVTSVVV